MANQSVVNGVAVKKSDALPREVTRHVKAHVENMLWGKAAGRCQFAGCNKPLWKSSVTQEQVNIAQKAHIYSFSDDGPRGNDGVADEDLNELSNLMLVCHGCHQKMDEKEDGGRYSVKLLQTWKADHEARVERVTGIDRSKKSHIILYGAPVGDFAKPLSYTSTAHALFPDHYPAEDRAITLQMVNSVWRDRDVEFWMNEEQNLRRQFAAKIKSRLESGELEHLSLFGFAPQPLLILLGTLVIDIPPVQTYQLRREPPGWSWDAIGPDARFIVREPAESTGQPALVLSISATVQGERIRQTLGNEVAIWEVTIDSPNNDFLRTRQQLSGFRQSMRGVMDRIKAAHGQNTVLNIFPAMPVAAAIDLGRIRMPRADMPWRIYDQSNAHSGFILALTIPPEQTR